MNGDELLTVDETAARLKTPERFVRRLVAERRIPYTKVGKYLRFYRSDVEKFIESGRVDPFTAAQIWRDVRKAKV